MINYCINKNAPTDNSGAFSKPTSTNRITELALPYIRELGHKKSSFTGKLKAVVRPIGRFLWKNLFSPLHKVLQRIGLFPSHKEPLDSVAVINDMASKTLQKPQVEAEVLNPEVSKTIAYKSRQTPLSPTQFIPREANQLETLFNEETTTSCPRLEISKITESPNVFLEPERFTKIELMNPPIIYQTQDPLVSMEPDLVTLFKEPSVTKKDFFIAAEKLFGKNLIDKVKSWEGLNTWNNLNSPDTFTRFDFLHALAAIGHGVTLNDLAQLLEKVNRKQIALKLSKTERDISKLPTEDIKKLVAFFRNPLQHLSPDENKILWEDFEIAEKETGSKVDNKLLAYTRYEYYIHKLAEESQTLTNEEERKLLYLAASEKLARFVAYAKPETVREEGMIIPVFNVQHGISYYELKNSVHNNGLHCYLFTPLNKDSDLPAQLVFRGTAGLRSTERDVLDPKGIGKTVFDMCAPKIAEMISKYWKSKTNPSLEICGHSLGASDAQRATILCLKLFNDSSLQAKQQSSNSVSSSYIPHISCSTFCSPKLDPSTIKEWDEEIRKFSKNPQLQIKITHAYHQDDSVTWAGYKGLYIPEDLSFPDGKLQEAYLHIESDSGFIATSEHHRAHFFKGARFDTEIDNRSYTFCEDIQKLTRLKAQYAEQNKLIEKNHPLHQQDSSLDSYEVADYPQFCLNEMSDSIAIIEEEPLPYCEKEQEKRNSISRDLALQIEINRKIDSCKEGFSPENSKSTALLAFLFNPFQRVANNYLLGSPKEEELLESTIHSL